MVKEVVFIGSVFNFFLFKGGVDNGVVGWDFWNDGVFEVVWVLFLYDVFCVMFNYFVSKVVVEKEVWKFVKENEVFFNIYVIFFVGLIGELFYKKYIEG